MYYTLLTWALSLQATLTTAVSSGYAVQKPPLDTPWTYKVGTNPWPEYPRPQRARSAWQSLNGLWSLQNASGAEEVNKLPDILSGRPILVPSCIESGLSGIQELNHTYAWYTTTFDVPSNWSDKTLLNFGAADYEATVFVNGKNVSFHRGGYFEWEIDISKAVKAKNNTLQVFIHDPTDSGDYVIPLGKQTLEPGHIFYRACTGIWQSVWIESAPSNYINDLHLSADMHGKVNVTVAASCNTTGKTTTALVSILERNSTKAVATHQCQANIPCTFSVASPKLWSPDAPHLYDVIAQVGSDTVHSYTGFRTISKGVVNSVTRPILNGKPIFQMGTLDQGFWPDGLYTPPNREAQDYDLKVLKRLGFNMVRKHIKVENALWYQSCDEMGLLVIQDMPALDQKGALPNATQQAEFESQLKMLIKQLRNYPSIGTWIIYNEGWGQIVDGYHPEFALTDLVRSMDPTRLIDSTTGWYDHGAGDYSDNHHYANPQCGTPFYSIESSPYDPTRIAIQGEFGGIGNNVSIEHLWNVPAQINNINQTYELDESLAAWNFRSHMLLGELRMQTELFSCSGAVWTQTTDVESELNGLLTYDRRILRTNETQWRADIMALYAAMAKRTVMNATVPAPYEGAGPDGKVWWNYESLDWMPNGYQT